MPFDPADSAFLDDPYPTFSALRAIAPVHEHPMLGMPVAVSHAACSEVLRGRSLGRIWADAQPAAEFPTFNLLHRNSLLEREGEPHDRLRTLVAGAFNRGHAARLEPAVRALADRLVAELAVQIRHTGSADLMAGVAHAAAGRGDRRAARACRSRCGRGSAAGRPRSSRCTSPTRTADGGRAAETASAEFVDALRELIAHRREHPGDDLVSDLVAADLTPSGWGARWAPTSWSAPRPCC